MNLFFIFYIFNLFLELIEGNNATLRFIKHFCEALTLRNRTGLLIDIEEVDILVLFRIKVDLELRFWRIICLRNLIAGVWVIFTLLVFRRIEFVHWKIGNTNIYQTYLGSLYLLPARFKLTAFEQIDCLVKLFFILLRFCQLILKIIQSRILLWFRIFFSLFVRKVNLQTVRSSFSSWTQTLI